MSITCLLFIICVSKFHKFIVQCIINGRHLFVMDLHTKKIPNIWIKVEYPEKSWKFHLVVRFNDAVDILCVIIIDVLWLIMLTSFIFDNHAINQGG